MIRQFIQDVVNERNGFRLDRSHRLGEKTTSVIIPVIRETRERRGYITLAEARDVKIEDTGQIDYVYVKNMEDKPLYISRGEIFKGKTQERAAVHGHIVMPNKGLRVAVRCIHKSKGIQSGTDMVYGGKVPYQIDLGNQYRTWEGIYKYNNGGTGTIPMVDNSTTTDCSYTCTGTCTGEGGSINISTLAGDGCATFNGYCDTISLNNNNNDSDDLVKSLETLSDNVREAMKKVKFIENQVGVIFFEEISIKGLDIYDIPQSWDSVKKDIIEKEGSSFIDDEDDFFLFDPDKVKKFAQKKLSEEFTEKVIYDKEYTVVEIKYNDLLGEATIFNNKVIHLTLWKK